GSSLRSHHRDRQAKRLRSHRHGLARQERDCGNRARQCDDQGADAHENSGFGLPLISCASPCPLGIGKAMAAASTICLARIQTFAYRFANPECIRSSSEGPSTSRYPPIPRSSLDNAWSTKTYRPCPSLLTS